MAKDNEVYYLDKDDVSVLNQLIRQFKGNRNNVLSSFSRQADGTHWLGIVQDKGPKDPETQVEADDYTDERYWVKRADISESADETTAVALAESTLDEEVVEPLVTVTNLTEALAGSHRLSVGDYVLCWSTYDEYPTARHYMVQAAGIKVAIVNLTDGGTDAKYEGTVTWSNDTTIDGLTTFGDEDPTVLTEINDKEDVPTDGSVSVIAIETDLNQWVFSYAGGGALSFENNGTAEGTRSTLNIPTDNGSNDILAFADDVAGGKMKLTLQAAAGENMTLRWTGTVWIMDYPKLHA